LIADYFMPTGTTIQQHPVYIVEARTRRGKRVQITAGYLLRMCLLVLVPMGLMWLGMMQLRLLMTDRTYRPGLSEADIIITTSGEVIAWLFIFSVLAGGLLDAISVLTSATGINRERAIGHWDLLRMTNLKRREVIHAKHALAQERTWRLLVLVMAMRVTVIVLGVIHTMFIIPLETDRSFGSLFAEGFREVPFQMTAALVILTLFVLVYVLEPIWRVWAVTAMGTAVSARISGITPAILTGLAGIGLMWLGQGGIAVGYFIGIFTMFGDVEVNSTEVGLMLFFFVEVVFALIIFQYYRGLRQWALRRATRDAFAREV
jgi:hypothetical protein